MLRNFKISNFQSHKESSLEFDQGVNVIWGESQSGKTAILRALTLLTTNRPLGSRFFSDFAGQKGTTDLSLTLAEGSKIGLKKNISINKDGKKEVKSSAYSLNGDEENYRAFGDKVPDQIETLLNLTDLNVQKQFDEPFLICSSAGEVAKVLDKTTRLEKADQYNSKLTTQVNTNRNEVKILNSEQKKAKKALKRYENVLEFEREVQRAERMSGKLESVTAEMAEIEKKRDGIISKQEDLKALREWLEIEKPFEETWEIFEKKEQAAKQILLLEDLVKLIVEVEEDKQYYEAVASAEGLVEESLQLVQETKNKEKEVWQVGQILSKLEEVCSMSANTNLKKEDFVSEYVLVLKELGKCPTCFSIIDEERMDEIIKEI